MRRLLIIVFLILVVIVAGGFYQGWFTVSSPVGIEGDKKNINLEIDSGKMKEDADALTTKAKELTDNATGSNREVDDK
ncbi:hypothetical protein SH449x_002857 [Pirellulaceae bacterium SH449]